MSPMCSSLILRCGSVLPSCGNRSTMYGNGSAHAWQPYSATGNMKQGAFPTYHQSLTLRRGRLLFAYICPLREPIHASPAAACSATYVLPQASTDVSPSSGAFHPFL
jgi:hypothetical protein